MKKQLVLIAALCAFLAVGVSQAFAQDKIAFINVREIMKNSNAGKKASDELKKVAEKKQAEIGALEKDIQAIKKDIETKSSIMTAQARRDKETEYQKKLRDYELMVRDANTELSNLDKDMFEKLFPEILKVVNTIAEKEKYTLVLDIASMPMPYYDKSRDISKKVVEEFNKLPAGKK
ncbi:MAG TPA: OmpH family outer membrane protein [Smithellaceae bacterium]|nr:OmpH family outer membrane protein [Smithellaceae bacterium]